ncbi:hypothetical protein PPROV_000096200 [Pycnococcus provasolii]|uniref:Uncharacterized protein n=1 Tax=Pycnococcus provasolii TaxID=41880 RepID=A0A830H572_9CHLO|nr:hypothetical protein PPROV_000096200 [Pycnococcus provasolii]|mmetsp:Transcript_9407/g.21379  ORF Transcript_9407/g.21379 Transcript_9407/m.21379 type:complete len:195 (+) Transcript_9407:97-681(+)|eukprot:CAMPEP_0119191194 /NCGR_PEP_ID=MMETSP1316-20130426/2071_1 /TAXON_ID=41880 /ORGANISM="Pycnococcus provasolii, Strain RCC2336" /LENGTH=194 /DNA_ID=CAMNT_0007186187 /DNA_START=92 /DNA_END=676 /DNA_ORIENTATION=-
MIASSRSLRVSKAAAPVQRRSVKVAASASSSSPVVKSIAAASAAAIVFTQLPALALDSAKLLIATPDQANFLKYIDESKQGDSSFKRGGERFPFAEGGRTPAEQKARLTRAVKDFNDLEPFVKKGYWLEVQSGMRRKMGYARYDIENLSGKQPVDLVQKFEALDLACRAKDFDGAAAAYADAKEALASAVNGLA